MKINLDGCELDACPNCGTTWIYGFGGYYCLDCGMFKSEESNVANHDEQIE